MIDGRPPLCIKAGDQLIPFDEIRRTDISGIQRGEVTILTRDGENHLAVGFDAIEAVMALKPSALEGLRLSWRPHAWAFHNIAGHIGLQVLAWMGMKRLAVRWHDWTTPRPRGFRTLPQGMAGRSPDAIVD